MTLRQSLILAASGIVALTLGACSTVKEHSTEYSNTLKTAKIMSKDKAQVAVTLNKNLSFDILGVREGKRVEPCKKGKGTDCHFDPDNIFAQKTFTITVVKGSCCAYISGGSSTYKFCTPEYSIEFIRMVDGDPDVCK